MWEVVVIACWLGIPIAALIAEFRHVADENHRGVGCLSAPAWTAEAAASRAARTPYEFSYDIAIADPAIQPDTPVSLVGWNPLIDGIDWLVKSVETSFDGSSGLRQRVELESA